MATTFSQSDLDALDLQIKEAQVVGELWFDNQRTKFRSMTELLEWRAFLERQVAGDGGTTSRTRYAATQKGT